MGGNLVFLAGLADLAGLAGLAGLGSFSPDSWPARRERRAGPSFCRFCHAAGISAGVVQPPDERSDVSRHDPELRLVDLRRLHSECLRDILRALAIQGDTDERLDRLGIELCLPQVLFHFAHNLLVLFLLKEHVGRGGAALLVRQEDNVLWFEGELLLPFAFHIATGVPHNLGKIGSELAAGGIEVTPPGGEADEDIVNGERCGVVVIARATRDRVHKLPIGPVEVLEDFLVSAWDVDVGQVGIVEVEHIVGIWGVILVLVAVERNAAIIFAILLQIRVSLG